MNNIDKQCVNVGKRIRARREELGMSQEELAKKIGYKSKVSISKLEQNARNVTQTKIKALADALETTPDYLMGWNDQNTLIEIRRNIQRLSDAELRALNYFVLYTMALREKHPDIPFPDFYDPDVRMYVEQLLNAQRKLDVQPLKFDENEDNS